MITRPHLLPLVLTLLGIGAVLAVVHVSSPKEPSPDEWRVILADAITLTIPDSVRSCGYVSIDQDPDQAKRCIAAAKVTKEPYWVASQAAGEDSLVWFVVYKSADQRMVPYLFDSYGWQQRTKPSFTVREGDCSSLKLRKYFSEGKRERNDPAFTCD